MEDKRPIVYVVRALNNYESQPIAYFVSKAHLQTKKTYYNLRGTKQTEYEVDYADFELDLSEFADIPDCFVDEGYNKKCFFIYNDYTSCKQHVNALNKDLLIKFLKRTDYKIISRAQKFEHDYISKEEMQGINEEKEQE